MGYVTQSRSLLFCRSGFFCGGDACCCQVFIFGLFSISLSADCETGKKMHGYLTRVVFVESIAVWWLSQQYAQTHRPTMQLFSCRRSYKEEHYFRWEN